MKTLLSKYLFLQSSFSHTEQLEVLGGSLVIKEACLERSPFFNKLWSTTFLKSLIINMHYFHLKNLTCYLKLKKCWIKQFPVTRHTPERTSSKENMGIDLDIRWPNFSSLLCNIINKLFLTLRQLRQCSNVLSTSFWITVMRAYAGVCHKKRRNVRNLSTKLLQPLN